MANQGAKRQVENNRRKLQFLQQLIFIATVCAASDGLAVLTAFGNCLVLNIILADTNATFMPAFQAVYALGRLAIFYKSSGTRHYVVLTLGSLIHFACYSFIKQQAGTGLCMRVSLCDYTAL